jgi:uncharacterized sulfatase
VAPTRPEEELYDLQDDPYEINNLAALPEYRSVKERLSAALETWMQETKDQGHIEEPAEIVEFWEAKMKENYESRPKKTLNH